ncbi:amidohydrolase family protein [Deferrisoma camini]|uniref:amidohydrolase family protein n=1 Tax=Deferrisoma camini TaxID=1035120 RepID=UPI00046C9179|nr:amidohydrolase family protein [Deferrisoma camini]
MARTKVINLGTVVSGDVSSPLIGADTLLIADGVIAAVGPDADVAESDVDRVIDANGCALTPGLIDSHVHPVLGDFTPRQKQVGFLESELHGGVTTAVSAGEVHLPGRPRDPAGVKALAILAARSFAAFRPGGMKVKGGAVILEPGLTEADFAEMAAQGVRTVGEIGLGAVKRPEDARPMVEWAKGHGMVVLMHMGGTSIPGSSTVTAEQVLAAGADVACHTNGGPTAVSPEEISAVIRESDIYVEIVHCGNPRMAVHAAREAVDAGALHRVIIGNDAPSGTGVIPLGVQRVIAHLSSLAEVDPAVAIAWATGNTARCHGLPQGRIAAGAPADLVFCDAPMGSVGDDLLSAYRAGDTPGVSVILVDGEVVVAKSRNTPPPKRAAVVRDL